MSFSVTDKSRIGRSAYWTAFIINIVAIIGLMIGMVTAALGGHFAMAILLFLLIAPVGIYFRVVMMRRCRDIGWPAFLPWALFGAGIVANLSRIGQGVEGLRNPGAGTLPLLVSLIDFAFMIAIGCIDGRDRGSDYARHFLDDEVDAPLARPAAPRAATRSPTGFDADAAAAQRALLGGREAEEAGWDAAIARALAAREQQTSEQDVHRPVAPGLQRPSSGLQRPAGGFGRRVV